MKVGGIWAVALVSVLALANGGCTSDVGALKLESAVACDATISPSLGLCRRSTDVDQRHDVMAVISASGDVEALAERRGLHRPYGLLLPCETRPWQNSRDGHPRDIFGALSKIEDPASYDIRPTVGRTFYLIVFKGVSAQGIEGSPAVDTSWYAEARRRDNVCLVVAAGSMLGQKMTSRPVPVRLPR